jgi:hypothetical protein
MPSATSGRPPVTRQAKLSQNVPVKCPERPEPDRDITPAPGLLFVGWSLSELGALPYPQGVGYCPDAGLSGLFEVA